MDEASIFFNPRSRAADEAIAVNDDGQGLFFFWHFSPGDKIEKCSAKFLAVCWIVRVGPASRQT